MIPAIPPLMILGRIEKVWPPVGAAGVGTDVTVGESVAIGVVMAAGTVGLPASSEEAVVDVMATAAAEAELTN